MVLALLAIFIALKTWVGVVGFEPTQPKQWIYSPSRLSNCGAPPSGMFPK